MLRFKYLAVTLLSIFMVGCASEKSNFSIKTSAKNNTVKLGESVKLSLNNPDGLSINSITYLLDGKPVTENLKLDNKLGKQDLIAQVITGNDTIIAKSNLIVLNNKRPKLYTYEIINTYPHDATSYTQGLEFYKGELYESTGQFGESKLRKVDYKTGEVLKNTNLNDGYFAEGLTVLDDKIYQLTWKADTGIIYDVNTFEKQGIFRYNNSLEGWGLCNDGKSLYKSDGTEKIWTLNTSTFTEDDKIEIYTDKGKLGRINELEWINGKIYANIYEKSGIAIINPKNGATEGVIDFTPITKLISNYSSNDNVLNGIAYNPETETIFVTGKRWDKLFEVKISKK
ncbi:MAG: glutaminyl-peptide cyclotransferase [Winogradskyella sp.]|uniref:glutaminyl-peptide cyclotransferase n=1 Tax=Winogradskyella sp. TaxID=1883156 RepID=UPI00184743FA|nr:glutaminyl-peptide cyclotransferase [Winogradskyella sp.]MBT8244383.1 glutaminyl-peptide cyclotransferase [Winogradskyella sp.]NNK23304.1 glutaminyl-peptide cyclotransferase [Winogradskyella sp.]